ncbi:DUF1273 domain-containing protein [Anaerobacillus sp. MEB173]|uniref:DUF1273 domain-containing protein n=1 Tax=Anaerobacillus sp. MEB173 TaxID=3383345 RepID=UPI003F92311B
MLKRLLVTGYKAHELGVFNKKHPGIHFIKQALENQLISLLEDGLEWIIISGQLGVEIWAAEVAIELRLEYPQLQLAVITPFIDQEKNWNEEKQEDYHYILAEADFVDSITKIPYEGPWQFREKNKFLLRNSDGLLIVYDSEKEGSPKYIYEAALKEVEFENYTLLTINSYDLQVIAEEEQMKQWDQ